MMIWINLSTVCFALLALYHAYMNGPDMLSAHYFLFAILIQVTGTHHD